MVMYDDMRTHLNENKRESCHDERSYFKKIDGIRREIFYKNFVCRRVRKRAWGFAAENSDYDVRFIYVHHPNWYLSIDAQGVGSKKDSMEFPINDYLDINGWEITKALRLF